MKNLDQLLQEGEPEKNDVREEKRPIISSLQITKFAFEKASAYAKIVCEEAGHQTMECGGYLIAPKDAPDRIATDAFLARNQDVSSGTFFIEAEDVIKAGREIDRIGYKVLGWWHSHGYLKTFFSDIDKIGQMSILNEIAAINYITQREEIKHTALKVEITPEGVALHDARKPGRKYHLSGDVNSVTDFKIVDEKRISFAYGLVVNAQSRGKPYAEVALRDFCGYCRGVKDVSYQVPVALVDHYSSVPFDKEELRAEVQDRVQMKKKVFAFLEDNSRFGHRSYLRSSYKHGNWQERERPETEGNKTIDYGKRDTERNETESTAFSEDKSTENESNDELSWKRIMNWFFSDEDSETIKKLRSKDEEE